jgi:hypothetical protein
MIQDHNHSESEIDRPQVIRKTLFFLFVLFRTFYYFFSKKEKKKSPLLLKEGGGSTRGAMRGDKRWELGSGASHLGIRGRGAVDELRE